MKEPNKEKQTPDTKGQTPDSKVQSPNTETLILQSAEQEFVEKGFGGARTTDIARRAGVTHAMLHYYFRTKEKLFERVLSDKIVSLTGIVLEVVTDENLSLKDCLRHGIERHFDFLAANPSLPLFLLTEMRRNPAQLEPVITVLREKAEAVVSGLQHRIDAAADAGECRRMDAVMLLQDIISLNIMSFIGLPILAGVFNRGNVGPEELLERRCNENIEVILSRLSL